MLQLPNEALQPWDHAEGGHLVAEKSGRFLDGFPSLRIRISFSANLTISLPKTCNILNQVYSNRYFILCAFDLSHPWKISSISRRFWYLRVSKAALVFLLRRGWCPASQTAKQKKHKRVQNNKQHAACVTTPISIAFSQFRTLNPISHIRHVVKSVSLVFGKRPPILWRATEGPFFIFQKLTLQKAFWWYDI